MDEDITFKKPENVTTEQAATIGVGILVSIHRSGKSQALT